MNTSKKKISVMSLVLVVLGVFFGVNLTSNQQNADTTQSTQAVEDDLARIERAFQQKQGDLQVKSKGTVIALLRDDNEGSRHQKFLLELANGQTVLVAHNIDLSPRIENLKKGDVVEFYGEYEYSEKGGVIHWTHHDPSRKHVDGWLKHHGKIFQ